MDGESKVHHASMFYNASVRVCYNGKKLHRSLGDDVLYVNILTSRPTLIDLHLNKGRIILKQIC